MMEAVALGPLIIPVSRLLALLALLGTFVGIRWWRNRYERDLEGMLWLTVVVGFVVARASFALAHWPAFQHAPWSVFYFWQDGYDPRAGVVAACVFAAIALYRARLPQRVLQLPLLIGVAIWWGGSTLFAYVTPQHHLPAMTLEDLQGNPVAVEDYLGQPVVINLWASWCPPCRREMPTFQAAQQAHPDVHFVFPNQRESRDAVRGFLAEWSLMLRNVLRDPNGEFAEHFGARGMPTTLFFDADGRLVDSHLGEVSGARLRQYLNALR